MDIKCIPKDRHGKSHWACGYQILIGRDGIARNVPTEAAAVMLSNPAVWVSVDGMAPPPDLRGLPLRGHQVAAPSNVTAAETVVPVTIRVQEVSLVPRSLEYLEHASPEVLESLCSQFQVEPPELGETNSPVARRILVTVDEQLLAQLRAMASPKPAMTPTERAAALAALEVAVKAPEEPEIPLAAASVEEIVEAVKPTGKKGKKAAKSGQPAEVEQS